MTKVRYTPDTTSFDGSYFYESLARVTKIADWIDGTNELRYGYDDGGRDVRVGSGLKSAVPGSIEWEDSVRECRRCPENPQWFVAIEWCW